MTIRVGGAAVDPLVLKERAAPAAAADTGKVYVKDVAGRSELFYRDDTGAEVQMTSGGVIVGGVVDTLAATLVAGNTAGGTAMRIASGIPGAPGLAWEADATIGWRYAAPLQIWDGLGTSGVTAFLTAGRQAPLGGALVNLVRVQADQGLYMPNGTRLEPAMRVSGAAGVHTGPFWATGADRVDVGTLAELAISVDTEEQMRLMKGIVRFTPNNGVSGAERLRLDTTGVSLFGVPTVARSTGWSVAGLVSDKTFDASATTLTEVANVLGTLVTYFLSRGDLGA